MAFGVNCAARNFTSLSWSISGDGKTLMQN